ncbi:YqaA family protein [Rhodospirillum centenum]|uniref:Membrane protein, putative n=1 Tax=Rhodospirillum centenum (strain ATCC 51521 / SW) TaxID=414684 RepID=B6IYT6_RHOCS|nr:YqaA family protein [Rhodospirillum centenum]ACJ01460.1 membrane protein, putative [Rhodospirillum centenum SW]
MIRKLYDWTMRLATHRHALRSLAGVSFAESSFFPIPPDVMLIPMVLADRRRAFLIATVCTAASALGGLFGYLIGHALYEAVAEPLLRAYGYTEAFREFERAYKEWGVLIVAGGALTPFPYKITTIFSGMVGMSIPAFFIASVLARGLRFYAVAALLYWFGEPIRGYIERNLGLLTVIFFVLLVGGFAAVKLLF